MGIMLSLCVFCSVAQMGFENLTVSGSLRVNYEKILYSYEMFMARNGCLEVRKGREWEGEGED